jgi:hypothetical protein
MRGRRKSRSRKEGIVLERQVYRNIDMPIKKLVI